MECLKLLIEKKRKQMIHYGLRHGFTNIKTITLSQELDKLINQVIHLNHKSRQNA
ncbi:MAG TPA: aspartyl-phosphate phosphatase Spo0E family protein [Bacillus bacterium]|nr:aspartyl-phosphate phosphatase Spo0E family protein [Bacillus sp. (in: firmicutes)]